MISLEYLAGYFDGEGCVSFTKAGTKYPSLRIAVATADLEVLQEFFKRFGGSLSKEKQSGRRRQMYRWYVCGGSRAQEILKELLPFLVAKRPQAELAMIPDFRQGKVGKRLTNEERRVRLDILEQVQAINQRITVEQGPVN